MRLDRLSFDPGSARLATGLVALWMLALPASAAPGDATGSGEGLVSAGRHVHGLVDVAIAQDGGTLTVLLDGAADNFTGFEHAAVSDQEKQMVVAVRERLARGSSLFGFGGPKGCVQTSATVDTTSVEPKAVTEPAENHEHDHDHDHDHDHEKGGKPHAHGNISAEYSFTCAGAAPVKAVTFGLFAAFPNIEKVEVSFIGETATSATATPEAPRVAVTGPSR